MLTMAKFGDVAEPEVVYHYTTMDTLMKIAKDASIWATSISYLNDTSEGQHFLQLVRDRIPRYGQLHTLEDKDIFAEFLKASDRGFESRPFVASFSQEGDSLSQWRSYCPNGNGVSIGFRVDCLKRAFVERGPDNDLLPEVTFKAIDYLDASSFRSLDSAIDAAIRESTSESRENLDVEGHPIRTPAEYFEIWIEQSAGFKKHPSFSNEFEYRLLVNGTLWNQLYFEFRPTRSTLVPYIPIHIPRVPQRSPLKGMLPPFSGHWDFIDRVVIGPTPNKDLSLAAVAAFFYKQKMTVEVVSSDIPYRDW
jgi:hypothetical protein